MELLFNSADLGIGVHPSAMSMHFKRPLTATHRNRIGSCPVQQHGVGDVNPVGYIVGIKKQGLIVGHRISGHFSNGNRSEQNPLPAVGLGNGRVFDLIAFLGNLGVELKYDWFLNYPLLNFFL